MSDVADKICAIKKILDDRYSKSGYLNSVVALQEAADRLFLIAVACGSHMNPKATGKLNVKAVRDGISDSFDRIIATLEKP